MDLYEPTLYALEAIDKSISVGGLIVFDEGYKKVWSAKLAIKDFLKGKKNYKKIVIDKRRQPDIILKKLKIS